MYTVYVFYTLDPVWARNITVGPPGLARKSGPSSSRALSSWIWYADAGADSSTPRRLRPFAVALTRSKSSPSQLASHSSIAAAPSASIIWRSSAPFLRTSPPAAAAPVAPFFAAPSHRTRLASTG